PMVYQHEVPRKRQFKRPGDFKPDPISLHGFHELSYLTPQNIHTVTDLFGFDYGVDLPKASTAPSLPTVSRHTDPLLPLSYTPPEVSVISTVRPSTEHLLAVSRRSVATSGLQAFLRRPLVQAIAGLVVGIIFL